MSIRINVYVPACKALERAEAKIQRILLDLEEETGEKVDLVNVDTRNFANLSVEVFFAERPRSGVAGGE